MAKLVAVVNDEPDFLRMMQDLLGEDGYRVATAYEQGGVTAQLRSARPDLIVLDLMLGLAEDGWAILEEVRRDADLAATPVIVCTAARTGVERAADLQRLRAEALTKPFHIEGMLALVRRLIGPAEEAAGG